MVVVLYLSFFFLKNFCQLKDGKHITCVSMYREGPSLPQKRKYPLLNEKKAWPLIQPSQSGPNGHT